MLTRRQFCTATGAALGALAFPYIGRAAARTRKVIVLAADGMDPKLTMQYIREGRLPNCAKLMQTGAFRPLRTSDPPQSPVAWSNFIAGGNPGAHGIFDFIARDSETLVPYLSTARTLPPKHSLRLGKFSLPISGARVELLRHGPTLWKLLQEGGIDSTVFRAPVNVPPTECDARTIAGLSTPDIHGSYGIFSFYTEDPNRAPGDIPGGQIERLSLENGLARCRLRGPANSFRTDGKEVNVDFTVELNPERNMVRLRIQSHEFLLRRGEWSPWVPVEFPMIRHVADVSGICRFYLKRTRPHLELYISPINIDPADPTMPISTPADYSRDLVRSVGRFYTQGMPEDTSALSSGVFSDDDYRSQATECFEESARIARYELDRFNEGFLYLYFSSMDLDSHAFWRCIDKQHPLYSEAVTRRHGDFLPWLYGQIDELVGRAMKHIGEDGMLLLMSDHGFVSFRRQFNLNGWLMDHGFSAPVNRFDRGQTGFFMNTDWRRTSAYGLGINSLYLNIRGREPDGTVAPGEEAERVRQDLIDQLLAVHDPQNGERVISNVYRPEAIYSGPYTAAAPDLIVAYNENYRASWDTILGKYPREHLLDNMDPWSGDHCMDSTFLPGVLLTNRPIIADSPALLDLAPTILNSFGLPIPPEMIGKVVI